MHRTLVNDMGTDPESQKGKRYVLCPGLTNAYGSVPHKLRHFVMEFFHIPDSISALVSSYFKDIEMCFTFQDLQHDDSNWKWELPWSPPSYL